MYGQLNELREEIMNKVMSNQDLLKFYFIVIQMMYYPNLTLFIGHKDSLKTESNF